MTTTRNSRSSSTSNRSSRGYEKQKHHHQRRRRQQQQQLEQKVLRQVWQIQAYGCTLHRMANWQVLLPRWTSNSRQVQLPMPGVSSAQPTFEGSYALDYSTFHFLFQHPYVPYITPTKLFGRSIRVQGTHGSYVTYNPFITLNPKPHITTSDLQLSAKWSPYTRRSFEQSTTQTHGP